MRSASPGCSGGSRRALDRHTRLNPKKRSGRIAVGCRREMIRFEGETDGQTGLSRLAELEFPRAGPKGLPFRIGFRLAGAMSGGRQWEDDGLGGQYFPPC